MDSYTPLLERTRVPQPSLQRLAVISIFEKLRSAPSYIGFDSDPGTDAVSQCLHSDSPALVDQAVRELCRLVADSKMELSRGLLEFQSAIEGSNLRFANLFVRAIGFIVHTGFQKNISLFGVESPESHPFIKVLSGGTEVHSQLVQQVLLLIYQNKGSRMREVCDFLRPFFNFSVLRVAFLDSSASSFVRNLISSTASFCCSFPREALPVYKMLMGCMRYYPQKNAEDFKNFIYMMECMVDAYTVILKHLAGVQSLINEAQLCGLELLETIHLTHSDHCKYFHGSEPIVELSKRLLVVQRELDLPYIPELSMPMLSLLLILIRSELEHEQLPVLRLVLFLLKWKNENEYMAGRAQCDLSEELLFVFPVINLVSSPSRSVKEAATDLLFVLEKFLVNFAIAPKEELSLQGGLPSISKPASMIFRLMQQLWFQDQSLSPGSVFLNFRSTGKTDVKEMNNGSKSWLSQLEEYSLWLVERRKSLLPISQFQEIFLTEMPLLLSAITCGLFMHHSLGRAAIDSLSAIGIMDPKLGVTMLLTILFFANIFSSIGTGFHDMLLKLLGMLPSIASHSVMIPLVVQTILPMLHKNAEPVLYATATRLLCKTWEVNDRTFGSLQGVLLPKRFNEFMSERNICISMAASLRDVCRKNPDRGVDLILSVSACIESQDPVIQSLGFQSLAHLCEADVIDFYTAWDVIAKHVLGNLVDPIITHSVCLLLRWGAMDAEAYSEASGNVLQILWEVGTSRHTDHGSLWAKTRASAFEALIHYEVPHIEKSIPDFKKRNMEFLISEMNTGVIKALEEFEVKIITHEHITRRRLIKQKKVPGNKIEKLLDVFPQTVFFSGKNSNPKELPGAALLCLSFTPKGVSYPGVSKASQEVHARYENAAVEIAASLQLSRNILLALLSLQSWKPFMQRWMKAYILSLNTKAPATILDKTSKAANAILKSMRRIAEESIPRSAENIALAMGALCVVLPPEAHAVKSIASKFLLDWLFQYEHEYRQWSAAIALGLISSCLHVTDHKQKFQNITGLLEVVGGSKNALVKGACGVGLGLSCQDLLTQFEAVNDSNLGEVTFKRQEMDLIGKVVRTLSQMVCQLTPSASNLLESLCTYFPLNTYDTGAVITSEVSSKDSDDSEEDIWGVTGLVLGLGSSVNAIYRAGAHEAVVKIKDLIISCIPHVNPLVQRSSFHDERSEIVLSVGSCLALPIVLAFCQRVELVNNSELNHIVSGYMELITELLSVRKSGTFHESLLMASCTGVGSLLACILNEGVHPMEVDSVKGLMELLRKSYSTPYPPIIHFGGMLGVVNALGAGAGNLIHSYPLLISSQTGYEQKGSSYIMGPLISSPACEPLLASLMQDIFLVAQNFDDHQQQQYAAWAISFLRHRLWTKETKELQNLGHHFQSDAEDSKPVSHSFSEDSTVMNLSLWLMQLNYSAPGVISHVNTVQTVLRCLSQAPRLPALDWGAIIRRCMRYEAQASDLIPSDSDIKKNTLREECLQFSLAHANQFDPLLSFLDELSELSRFSSLELNLQSHLLSHLGDLIKIFSGSKLEKLFDDISVYLSSSVSSYKAYNTGQRSLLRVSCWKGLGNCLDDVSVDSLGFMPNIEKCMEVLFFLLPALQSGGILGADQVDSKEEWSKAVNCLSKARRDWLLDLLQVLEADLVQASDHFITVAKKIQVRARLVKIDCIPLIELGRLKVHILNAGSHGIWDVLIEVVAALQHAEGSVKRQWLVDTIEISCVTNYPSTALQFLALLAGSCCKYMPFLILDRFAVLSDLPITLNSLLSEPNWEFVAESVVSCLWTSTERIYNWAIHISQADDSHSPSLHSIDKSENAMAAFLAHVMHQTCVYLKDYLPLEKQLKVVNMILP